MNSTNHERANELVVSQPQSSERQLKGGMTLAAYIIVVVVAMAGWVYLLSKLLIFCLWKVVELAVYVAS
jgi:hypothetical protein